LVVETVRFKYAGNTMEKEDIPSFMNMKDNSVIEVYNEQIGA